MSPNVSSMKYIPFIIVALFAKYSQNLLKKLKLRCCAASHHQNPSSGSEVKSRTILTFQRLLLKMKEHRHRKCDENHNVSAKKSTFECLPFAQLNKMREKFRLIGSPLGPLIRQLGCPKSLSIGISLYFWVVTELELTYCLMTNTAARLQNISLWKP